MKYSIIVLTMIILLCGCERKESSGEMDVASSRVHSLANGVTEELVIIVNQTNVEDYEKCAEEIIGHCLANDFASIKFSFDVSGYPNALKATAYLTEEDMEEGKVLFEMEYTANAPDCNIKDNPEQYMLEIKRPAK